MPSLRQYCGRLVAKLGINLCCRSPGLRSDLQYLADSYVHFILRWTLWKIIWWWTNKPQSKRSFTQLKRLRKLIKAIEENREILIHLKLERKETTHLSQIKTGSKEVDPQTATEKAKTPNSAEEHPIVGRLGVRYWCLSTRTPCESSGDHSILCKTAWHCGRSVLCHWRRRQRFK